MADELRAERAFVFPDKDAKRPNFADETNLPVA